MSTKTIVVTEANRSALQNALDAVQTDRMKARRLTVDRKLTACDAIEKGMEMTHAKADRKGARIRLSGGENPWSKHSADATVVEMERTSSGWRLVKVARQFACPSRVDLPAVTSGRQARALSQSI